MSPICWSNIVFLSSLDKYWCVDHGFFFPRALVHCEPHDINTLYMIISSFPPSTINEFNTNVGKRISTWTSPVVTHPSTIQTWRCLTSQIGRDALLSRSYRVDSNWTKVPLAHGISTSRSMNFELGFGVCLNKTKINLGLPAGKGADLPPPPVSSLASPHRPLASDSSLESRRREYL